MSKTIDYYFSPISPWTYLGHPRLAAMSKKYGATLNVKPMDLGKIFPVSGGLPLPQRAPQRQAYRLMELARWRDHLKMPLTMRPKFFPAPSDLASCCIVAASMQNSETAMRLTFALLRGVWEQERNIADVETLTMIANEQGLDGAKLIAQAQSSEIQAKYAGFTQEAMDRQVFGAPSFVIDDEIFWGQDRLEFVERKLASG